MIEIDGREYLNLGELVLKVHDDRISEFNRDSDWKKPIAVEKRFNLPLWINTKPLAGLFVYDHYTSPGYSARRKNKCYGTVFRFEDRQIFPGKVKVADVDAPILVRGLARIERFFNFCDNPCCSDARKYALNFDLDHNLNFCQFCGNETGIEKTALEQKVKPVMKKMDRFSLIAAKKIKFMNDCKEE